MIVKTTKRFNRKYQDLSDSEKERLKEICEELRLIFNADSAGFISPTPTLGRKCNYEIKIYNGDTLGYILDEGEE